MSISVASVADLGGAPPGSQPAWALTGDDLLAELDELHRAVAALQTRRLEVLARFDELGHAKELGARGTVELLSLRHRIDPAAVRRDLRLATALPKYDAVAAALPATTADITATDARADAQAGTDVDANVDTDAAAGATGDGPTRVRLHPGQAEVIVSALERVPSTVPAEDIEVAERALVTAAESLAPRDLRRLAEAAVDRLDPDGPEPDEEKARDQRPAVPVPRSARPPVPGLPPRRVRRTVPGADRRRSQAEADRGRQARPAYPRAAPGRCPDRRPPPRRGRRRSARARRDPPADLGHHQPGRSAGRRTSRDRRPDVRHRPVRRRGPDAGLRREHHPDHPRLRVPAAGRRPGRKVGHPRRSVEP